MARPTGVGRALATYEIPIEGRDEWLAETSTSPSAYRPRSIVHSSAPLDAPAAAFQTPVVPVASHVADASGSSGSAGGTIEYACLEAPIVQVADAICASRRGARGESTDTYVKRLEDLQAVAESFGGVERSFAVQAGREVRILVRPREIDDLTATRLARDIVKKIEGQLTYPGQIKVTVIRETRAVEYAK